MVKKRNIFERFNKKKQSKMDFLEFGYPSIKITKLSSI